MFVTRPVAADSKGAPASQTDGCPATERYRFRRNSQGVSREKLPGSTEVGLFQDRLVNQPVVVNQLQDEAVTPTVEKKATEEKTTPTEPPQQRLTKMTVTVKLGTDVQQMHYWVDEDDRIVAPPTGVDAQEYDAVPTPKSTKGSKDEHKKDDKKDGSGR